MISDHVFSGVPQMNEEPPGQLLAINDAPMTTSATHLYIASDAKIVV